MMLKSLCLVASAFLAASLVITAPNVSAESSQAFRQINGLQTYVPPEWFLGGYFIAREKNPGYVFGPVQDLSLIHISEPTRPAPLSRMPSSA